MARRGRKLTAALAWAGAAEVSSMMLHRADSRPRLGDMAIVKRLSVAGLAVAFMAALIAQAALPAFAMPLRPHMAAMNSLGTVGLDGQPAAPCQRTTPLCVEHVGCVLAVAISPSPIAPGAPIRWRAVAYDLAVSRLAGRSLEPELSRPIVAI